MLTGAGLLEGLEAFGLGGFSALGLRASLFDFFWPLAMMGSSGGDRPHATIHPTGGGRGTKSAQARRTALFGYLAGGTRRPEEKRALSDTHQPTATPVLLSGGNPQIAKGEGDAPVQAYIAAMPGWKRAVGERLDAIVTRRVPGVRKAVKWNSPFYGAPNAQGWFLSYHCFTDYVKVTFFRGQSLDPVPPVGSKSGDTRYFHVHDGDSLDQTPFATWVEQASALPGETL
jgi:hypothetical protein